MLTFDKEKERYKTGDGSIINHRVTQVVNAINPFDKQKVAFSIASNASVMKEPYYTIKNSVKDVGNVYSMTKAIISYWEQLAEDGTTVHKIAERALFYGIPYTKTKFKNEYLKLLEFDKVMNDNGFCMEYCETIVADLKLKVVVNSTGRELKGIGGRLDAIYVNKETKKYFVVDWKRSNKDLSSDPYGNWPIQLALYYLLIKKMKFLSGYKCEGLDIVQVHPDFKSFKRTNFTPQYCLHKLYSKTKVYNAQVR